jgi:hypothetical protein
MQMQLACAAPALPPLSGLARKFDAFLKAQRLGAGSAFKRLGASFDQP